ncbi:MAG: hypothetical protein AAF843_20975, partial [Bacteroidota bacterium]
MNKKIIFFFLAIITVVSSSSAQRQISLNDIISLARNQSPFAKQAETQRENRYWGYRFFKSNYNPQLRIDGSIPGYAKAFEDVTQPDGNIQFQSVNQIRSRLNLGLEQPLPWTGGLISVNSNLFYFDVLGDDIDNQLWRGSPFTIELDQPLFAFNELKWDKKTEPLRYEESKREYV